MADAGADTDDEHVGQLYRGVRTGGRSARVRQSVLEAAVAELTELGYEDLSLAGVARRAGVAPSTLHRRWRSKPGLILELSLEATAGMVPDPQGATLREDLMGLAGAVAAMLRDPSIVALLRAAFVLPEEQLGQLRERFWGVRMQVAQDIIDRAAARGEIAAGLTGWEVVEPVQATIWMRLLVTGLPVDEAIIERLVDRVLAQAGVSGQR